MNFFLSRKRDRLKARESQTIRDNIQPIVLEWECLWDEEMPVLREEGHIDLELDLKMEWALADEERIRKKWETLHISL